MKSDRKKLKKLFEKLGLGFYMNLGETLLVITEDDTKVNGADCFCQFVFDYDGNFKRLDIGNK